MRMFFTCKVRTRAIGDIALNVMIYRKCSSELTGSNGHRGAHAVRSWPQLAYVSDYEATSHRLHMNEEIIIEQVPLLSSCDCLKIILIKGHHM